MGRDLQLRDYMEGFRFQATCKGCGYGWYVFPAELLKLAGALEDGEDEDPRQWYLDEAARRLSCRRRCGKGAIVLTPQRFRRQHNFQGGMP